MHACSRGPFITLTSVLLGLSCLVPLAHGGPAVAPAGGAVPPAPAQVAAPLQPEAAAPGASEDEAQRLARAQVERGYDILVNGDYIGCGIPLSVLKRTLGSTPPVPRKLLALLAPLAGEAVFRESGIPGRNAENAGIAPTFNVFTSARGIPVVNSNCLSCHGESLNGTFVVGLGNRTRDFTQDTSSMARRLTSLARTPVEKEELEILGRATLAVAPYIQTRTIGVNPAVNLTYALMAHRRLEDYSWSEALTLEPPGRDFPPSDVPPWWHLREKGLMFYNGEFAYQHHRVMALASLLCVQNGDELRQRDEPFRAVERAILSLKSPAYPLPIDAALARAGQQVYEGTCARCHGEVDELGRLDYEPEIIPIEKIGTDPALMEQQSGPEHERFRTFGEASFLRLYGEGLKVRLNRGYIVPPLSGVWATAPYLHNGSIPTLEAVIDSSQRPRYWEKLGIYEQNDYDVARMGVRYRERTTGQSQAGPLLKRFIYDTTLEGYGSGGHTYGDSLTAAERLALLEFLKTL